MAWTTYLNRISVDDTFDTWRIETNNSFDVIDEYRIKIDTEDQLNSLVVTSGVCDDSETAGLCSVTLDAGVTINETNCSNGGGSWSPTHSSRDSCVNASQVWTPDRFSYTANGMNLLTISGGEQANGTGQIDHEDTQVRIFSTQTSTDYDTGALVIEGGVGIHGDLNVKGNINFLANEATGGTITFGDTNTDNVVFGADVDSNIIPNTDDTFDLGASAQQWKDIYINGISNLDETIIITDDGTFSVSGSNSFDIDVAAASRIATSVGDITIDSEAGTLILDGHTSVDIDSASTVTIDSETTTTLTSNGTIVHVITNDLTNNVDAGDVVNTSVNSTHTTSNDFNVVATNDIDLDATNNIEISATELVDVDGKNVDITAVQTLDVDGNIINLDGTSSVNIGGTGTTNNIGLTAVTNVDITANQSVSITSAEASTYKTNNGRLTVSGDDGVTIDGNNSTTIIEASGQTVDINATTLDVDTTGSINLDADTTSNFTSLEDIDIVAGANLDLDGLTVNIDATDSVKIATATSIPVTIGNIVSEVTFADNVTVTGNLTVQGDTTTVNTSTLTVEDHNIELGNVATPTDATANLGGITLHGTTDHTLTWNQTSGGYWNISEKLNVDNLWLDGNTITGDTTLNIESGSGTINVGNGDATNINIHATNYVNDSTNNTINATTYIANTTSYSVNPTASYNLSTPGNINIDSATSGGVGNDISIAAGESDLNLTGYDINITSQSWTYLNGAVKLQGLEFRNSTFRIADENTDLHLLGDNGTANLVFGGTGGVVIQSGTEIDEPWNAYHPSWTPGDDTEVPIDGWGTCSLNINTYTATSYTGDEGEQIPYYLVSNATAPTTGSSCALVFQCHNMIGTEEACKSIGGAWAGDQSLNNQCVQPLDPDGVEFTEGSCISHGGVWTTGSWIQPIARTGHLRFNTDTGRFEGFDGTAFRSIDGVYDRDNNTFIRAEETTGGNQNILEFFTDGVERFRVDGTAILPETNNNLDLGSSTYQFKNIWIDTTAYIDHLEVEDTTAVNTDRTTGSALFKGGVGIDGSLEVGGNIHAVGSITADGSLTLGDANTDNVVFNADVNSHIIPNTDNTYNLGSNSQQWKHIWINGTAYLDEVSIQDSTQSTTNGSGALTVAGGAGIARNVNIGGTLDVDGATTLNGNVTLGDNTADNIVFTGDVNSNILPQTDASYNLGSSSQQWKDIYINGTAHIDTVIVDETTTSTSSTTGALTVAGGVGIAENLEVGGNIHAVGSITSDGSLTLGDANTDNITFKADVNSNILPDATNTYNLGSSSKQWKDIYSHGTAHLDDVDIGDTTESTTNTTGALTVAGGVGISKNVNIGGTLDVDGATTLNGNVTLGNAATDTVSFSADVNTNIIPDDETRELGSTSSRWNKIHIKTLANIDGDIDIEGDIDMASGKLLTWVSDTQKISSTGSAMTIDSKTSIDLGSSSESINIGVSTDAANAADVDIYLGNIERTVSTVPYNSTVHVKDKLVVYGDFTLLGSSDSALVPVGGVALGVAMQSYVDADAALASPTLDAAGIAALDEGFPISFDRDATTYIYAEDDDDLRFVVGAGEQLSLTTTKFTVAKDLAVTGTSTLTGATSMSTASTSGLATLDSLSVTNAATLDSLSVTNGTSMKTASTSGLATLDSLSVTNGTSMKTASTSGLATLESLSVTNDALVGGDLTVSGDLTISGTTTTINTEEIKLADNIIVLNSNHSDTTAPTQDSGIEIERGTLTNATFKWIEDGDYWKASNKLRVDNLQIDANTISSINDNGDLVLSANGTGVIDINDTLDVDGITYLDNLKIDGNSISSTDTNGGIGLYPNGTGKVTIRNDSHSNSISLFTKDAATNIADTFTDATTNQSFISFAAVTGSNDSGFIMHETSSTTETNEGVLHLCPSDDSTGTDYVSIHGSNDADRLRLFTDGTIDGVTQLKIGTTQVINSSGQWTGGISGTLTGDVTTVSGDVTTVSGATGTVTTTTNVGTATGTITNVNSGVTISTVKSGATISTVKSGATITNIDAGVNFTNHTGTITTNTGAITTSSGTISTQTGTITNVNSGVTISTVKSGATITNIDAGVNFTNHSGTIDTNSGAITTSTGNITNVNSGVTISNVKSGAIITDVSGTVTGVSGTVTGVSGTVTNVNAGATISTVKSGATITTNSGAITDSSGAITTSSGTITTSTGNITNVTATISTVKSGATITNIDAGVNFTNHTGTITTNTGAITDSSGNIITNTGAIGSSSGTISTQSGSITNINTGVTISNVKSGATISTVESGATITTISDGVNFTNHTGTITTNTGAITTNHGTISTQEGNISVVASGATITDIASGATVGTIHSGVDITNVTGNIVTAAVANTVTNSVTVTNCTNLTNMPTANLGLSGTLTAHTLHTTNRRVEFGGAQDYILFNNNLGTYYFASDSVIGDSTISVGHINLYGAELKFGESTGNDSLKFSESVNEFIFYADGTAAAGIANATVRAGTFDGHAITLDDSSYYTGDGYKLTIQGGASATDYSGIKFISGTNSGSDYGFIKYTNDTSTYEPWASSASSECSELKIGSENDADTTNGDILVLAGKAATILDSPSLRPPTNNTEYVGTSTYKFAGMYATTFYGNATSANYADIAERYEADSIQEIGTVMGIGGDKEITRYQPGMELAGVISGDPAFRMNDGDDNRRDDMPFIALKGRVPVKIDGSAKKGQLIIAHGNGLGKAVDDVYSFKESRDIIGTCLEDGTNEVEVKV